MLSGNFDELWENKLKNRGKTGGIEKQEYFSDNFERKRIFKENERIQKEFRDK